MLDHRDIAFKKNLALWQAQAELRFRAQGDVLAANRVHDQLVDVASSVEAPNLFLAYLIRSLGRNRSLGIGIEKWVVERAL